MKKVFNNDFKFGALFVELLLFLLHKRPWFNYELVCIVCNGSVILGWDNYNNSKTRKNLLLCYSYKPISNTNLMILVYNYFNGCLVTLFRNWNAPEKRVCWWRHCKKQRFETTEDINKMSIKKVPKTTTYSTQWAMNNFDCWRLARNSRSVDEKVPENLFINGNEGSKFLADAVCIRN